MAETEIPVLQEHQSGQGPTQNNTDYSPTLEEKKLIKIVYALLDRSKKHKRKYDEKWLDYYKMFRGKQWKEQRPSYRHSEVVNFIFQAIQGMVPIITDSRPKFDFLPHEPQDMEVAKILSDAAQSDWENGNWLQKLTEVVYDAHFYGTGIGEVCFDPEAMQGVGAIDFKSKDIFYCFPDPDSTDVNEKSDFWIDVEPIQVGKLKKMYPDKAQYIKADVSDLKIEDKTDLYQVKYRSPVDNKTIMEGSSSYDLETQDKALKITLYQKCDDFDEEEKIDQVTGQKTYEQKLKYPNGRKVCVASGVLLDNGPSPYDDGLFPYTRLVNYILPREFWGMSEVEQLASPQKIFNKLVSFSLDVLYLMGNPVWVVDNDSQVDTDNLINRPGLIIEKAKGSEVRREEGVQLQPYVLQLIDRMQNWFQEISGRTDVTSGAAPGGVTAASAIQSLQEAAQTRMRLKSRNLDAFLQDFGQLYKNRAFQFYSAPKMMRLTGNENSQKYFKMHIEDGQDEYGKPHKKMVVRDYVQNAEGQYKESLDSKEYIIKGDFDVRVSTGSALPFAKEAKQNLAFKMFEAGAIDPEELLKSVEWPNWEAVLERQKQAAAAQAQAAPPPKH